MYIADKLKHRFQIKKTSLDVSDYRSGGLDQSYDTIATIWGAIKPVSENIVVASIRGVNSEEVVTHIITFRWIAIKSLGKAFNSGFSEGVKGISDLNPLKTQYYIFKQEGSSVKGRMFRIIGMMRDENNYDYIKVRVREIEEQGTGYGNE